MPPSDRLLALKAENDLAGVVMGAEAARFAALASRHADGTAPRAVSSFNLFQTPPGVAARLAGLLPALGAGARILEPSAGLGRLYTAARARHREARIILVEQAPQCCAELYQMTEHDARATLKQADFLTLTHDETGGLFDAVIMNPPFKQGRDIKHIRHALSFVRPGGRLVAICAAGPRQRAQLAPLGEWLDLPAGSFRSEGTNVDAAMIVIDK
jgi:hypothetical protein